MKLLEISRFSGPAPQDTNAQSGFTNVSVLVETREYVFILSASSTDVATVVGYLVVSRPFLNLSHPRHLRSSHSELLEV